MNDRPAYGFDRLAKIYLDATHERDLNRTDEDGPTGITVHLPVDHRDELDRLAAFFDVSLNVLCRDLIRVGADQMVRLAVASADEHVRDNLANHLILGEPMQGDPR